MASSKRPSEAQSKLHTGEPDSTREMDPHRWTGPTMVYANESDSRSVVWTVSIFGIGLLKRSRAALQKKNGIVLLRHCFQAPVVVIDEMAPHSTRPPALSDQVNAV